MSEDPALWARRLNAAVATLRHVRRAVVLAQVGSTQDAARDAPGPPGLLLATIAQTAGRGRMGRRWVDDRSQGVAATFVLDAAIAPLESISLGAGLAACRACAAFLESPGSLGLRWPNDVVERSAGRKVAGVLVERAGGRWLVGIGVNVLQQGSDWPPDLLGAAASLAQLGAGCDRPAVLERLALELDAALALDGPALAREWTALDTLRGTERAFLSGSRTVRGVVESIEPSSAVVVRTASGERVRLEAAATTLLPGP